jgi:hypothetical protein
MTAAMARSTHNVYREVDCRRDRPMAKAKKVFDARLHDASQSSVEMNQMAAA